ncbi:hypothetical protein DPMN_016102 [Dreissena polymorpha]|uniref:Uncharacterized protein n=1 Tax=Dreissena polymorpha TaxID=45954 RepID=A0A9D4S6U6_DREPO|nr:hypothetical protein DPMN_016102 [Dreissena polymorpha]
MCHRSVEESRDDCKRCNIFVQMSKEMKRYYLNAYVSRHRDRRNSWVLPPGTESEQRQIIFPISRKVVSMQNTVYTKTQTATVMIYS